MTKLQLNKRYTWCKLKNKDKHGKIEVVKVEGVLLSNLTEEDIKSIAEVLDNTKNLKLYQIEEEYRYQTIKIKDESIHIYDLCDSLRYGEDLIIDSYVIENTEE